MPETNRIEYKAQLNKDLELVEQLGSGIPRILEHYGKECFHFSENFLRMVFPAIEKITEQIGLAKGLVKRLVKGLVKELSESQVKILNLVESNSHITKREMAEQIGISTTAIDKNIKTLKKRKVLERVGGRKEGYWRIIEAEK